MKLRIDITDADIDEGYDSPRYCPVAIAANRALAAIEANIYGSNNVFRWRPRWRAEYEPYRAFCVPAGFSIYGRDEFHEPLCQVDEYVSQEMYYFACDFDDWKRADPDESGLGEDESDFPERPSPCTFIIDLPIENPAAMEDLF